MLKLCLGCQSFILNGNHALCSSCFKYLERHLSSQKHSRLNFNGKTMPHLSLLEWRDSQSLLVSLIIKDLKGGKNPKAAQFWGVQLAENFLINGIDSQLFLSRPADVWVISPPGKPNDHAVLLAHSFASEVGFSYINQALQKCGNRMSIPQKQSNRRERGELRFCLAENISRGDFSSRVVLVDPYSGASGCGCHSACGMGGNEKTIAILYRYTRSARPSC